MNNKSKINLKNISKPSKVRVALDTFRALNQSKINGKIPTQIGLYSLHSKIRKENGINKYFSGIFIKNKKKYFIKTWTGKLYDHNYQALVNELILNETLIKILRSERIRTPRIIEYFITDNSLSLVYEFIEGKNLLNYSIEKQARVWKDVRYHLLAVSKEVKNKRYLINLEKKNKIYYLKTLSLVTFLSLMASPKNYKAIFNSFFQALIEFTKFKGNKLVINHGDLSPDNILVSKNKIYILDCGRVSLTLPEYDLTYLSTKPSFRQLYKKVQQRTLESGNNFLKEYLFIQYIELFDTKHANVRN